VSHFKKENLSCPWIREKAKSLEMKSREFWEQCGFMLFSSSCSGFDLAMISTFTYEEGLWRQTRVPILLAESHHNFLCWELLVFGATNTNGVEQETRGAFGFLCYKHNMVLKKRQKELLDFGATNTTWC
jgi:hypothetical protein